MGFYSFTDVVADLPGTLAALEDDKQTLSRLSSDPVDPLETVTESLLRRAELLMNSSRDIVEALRRASVTELVAYPLELPLLIHSLPRHLRVSLIRPVNLEENTAAVSVWVAALASFAGRFTDVEYLKELDAVARSVGASVNPGVIKMAEAKPAKAAAAGF